jgi:hypothetical protein
MAEEVPPQWTYSPRPRDLAYLDGSFSMSLPSLVLLLSLLDRAERDDDDKLSVSWSSSYGNWYDGLTLRFGERQYCGRWVALEWVLVLGNCAGAPVRKQEEDK